MNEIRVIAPSDSWKHDREDSYKRAETRLKTAGYHLTFAQHIKNVAYLETAHAAQRAQDFNDAFADPAVKAIITLHGGFLSNEILPLINWQIVRDNPKPLIGYSDITVLCNAIYAKTGNPAFLGPNLGTLGYEELWEYSLENLLAVLRQGQPHRLTPSARYIDNQHIQHSPPWQTLQNGQAEGTLLGGNVQSFFLLQGTVYQPKLDQDFILAIEDDSLSKEYTLHGMARNLESILQLPHAREHIKGLLIGRFEGASKVSSTDLAAVIAAKNLKNILVIANVDFGHTAPLATLPIGGKIRVTAMPNQQEIVIM